MLDIRQICEITGLNKDPAKAMLAKHGIKGKRLELSTSQKQYFDVDEDRLNDLMKLRDSEYINRVRTDALNSLCCAFSRITARSGRG